MLNRAEKLYAKALKEGNGDLSLEDYEVGVRLKKKINGVLSGETEDVSKPTTQYSLQDSIKTLDGYTDLERSRVLANKMNSIAENYQDIVDFIHEAKLKENNRYLYLGKINSKLAERIHNETGIKVDGYSFVLSNNDVYHIFKEHGNENSEVLRGQIPITEDNIFDVIDTMLEPEKINKKFDKESGVTSIVFEKTTDGRFTSITVLSNDKRRLALKSARINKKRRVVSPSAQSAESGKSSTSETLRSFNSSNNNSISDKSEKVNTSDGKNKNNRYSLSENAKKAVEEFGTTHNLSKAGYILSDGQLLDLADEGQNKRTRDHRDISALYNVDYGKNKNELVGGKWVYRSNSDAMIAFINEGNIRMDNNNHLVSLGLVEPTEAQYDVIRRLVSNARQDGYFLLDIENEDGYEVVNEE
jgi:hypothetical protein